MARYFRDRSLCFLDCYDLSPKEIQELRENADYNNEILQLEYSSENLLKLREYREENMEIYQESLNDEELQKNLREWRNSPLQRFKSALFKWF